MAVLSRRGALLLGNIHLFLLWILISLICDVCSQGTFTLRDHEKNEVIFVGETITLKCRAPSEVRNPQFRLLDSQNIVAVDRSFTSIAEGHFGYPDSNKGGANFVIMIKTEMQNRYLCEISGDDGVHRTDEVSLNVSPRDSPQCFLNTSASVPIGEVIGLSCYQEVGMVPNSDFKLRQIFRDGTVNELPTEYSNLINQFKRKSSTSIIASLYDSGTEFECIIIDSGVQKTCKTGLFVYEVEDAEISIFPTNIYYLDKGESQLFTCESSLLRFSAYWERNSGYQNTDAEVKLAGDRLTVSIPTNTTLLNGTVLSFVCSAASLGYVQSETLLITIAFASGPNSDSKINEAPNSAETDFTIYLTIAAVVALVLVVIIAIILIHICMVTPMFGKSD